MRMPTVDEIITYFFILLAGLYLGTQLIEFKQIIFGALLSALVLFGLMKLRESNLQIFK